MTIDEHTAIISDLKSVERKTEQKLNATQQEKAKILKKIRQLKQQTERRRVHKKIVLGGAVLAAYVNAFALTPDEEEKILADDTRLASFGRQLVDYAIKFAQIKKENSDNV